MNSPAASVEVSARNLDRLLHPRSIAIIGASVDPRSTGGFVQSNLERFGFQGELHLVSRSSDEINGRPCLRSPEQLPAGIDVAVLAIPEAGVLDAIRVCGQRGVAAAMIFASGYAESGEEGQVKQQRLVEAAEQAGVLLIGPNCMGYTNLAQGIPVTFEPELIPYPGDGKPGVGIVAQSGAMAANTRDALVSRGIPVTVVASTGNEAQLGVEDYIAWFLDDPQTRVVAVYAEQIRRPQTFLQLARRARQAGKPVVLLMPGKSARARDAAQSHTGALAGDHASASALLTGEAVVLVDTLDELFDVIAVLARFPQPAAGGPAVVTGSGAVKNLSLDFAEDIGFEFPVLSPAVTERLRALLPSYAVAENPLDYTTISMRNPGIVGELIDVMLEDEAIGSAVLTLVAGPVIAQHAKADHMVPALKRAAKPTALVVMGDDFTLEPYFVDAIRDSGVPFFRSLDRALRALAKVAEYSANLQRVERRTTVVRDAVALPSDVPPSGVHAEYQGKDWLRRLGLATPEGRLARTVQEAVNVADGIGYPVVLKAQASALPHKSDVGGVEIGLADAAAVRAAWQRMQEAIARRRPDLVLDGILVETMGARGLELVVGARRDPQWGPVVLVGVGGIWIEALKDVRVIPPDMAEDDIVAELRRLKAATLLEGVRGAAAVDVRAVAQVVAAIGAQMLAHPDIVEIDINPLVAYPDQAIALDALLVTTPPGSGRQAV